MRTGSATRRRCSAWASRGPVPDPRLHHGRGGGRDGSEAGDARRGDREGDQRHGRGGRVKGLLALTVSAALVLGACRDGSSGAGGDEEVELTVSGASSLTAAFTDIGAAFEDANPGVTVTFNFGPSDGLATQINEGAPVDVFASASSTWMDAVQDGGPGVTGRTDFARNKLAIIVPADNPAGIESLEDLTAA